MDSPSPQAIAQLFDEGVHAYETGRWADARDKLERVLCEDPDQPMIRYMMSEVAQREGQLAEAVAHLRRGLAAQRGGVEPFLRFRLNRLIRAMESKAEPRDLLDGDIPSVAQKIAIFGPPASGVERFADKLAAGLGWRSLASVEAEYENEPELALGPLVALASENVVIRQPARCTEPTLQILQVFAHRPVFVIRSTGAVLHDLAARIAEGHGDGFLGPYGRGLGESDRLAYVTRRWGNWLVEQYVSFKAAHDQNRLNVLFIEAKDMMEDPVSVASRICEHVGVEPQPAVDWERPFGIQPSSPAKPLPSDLQRDLDQLRYGYKRVDLRPIMNR